ncbi:hypothetical protein ENBRE01_0970 [Enteropsectra breve]|nr:hypothetical protein ENBRE01_0970 [Enteropsectra breve]
MALRSLVNVAFIISPIIPFLPQIYKKRIVYSPFLSTLNILSNSIKILHYQNFKYGTTVLYQYMMLLTLHAYLLKYNSAVLKPLEERFMSSRLLKGRTISSCATAFLVSVISVLYLLSLYGAGHSYGVVACFLDVCITGMQLALYLDENKKPRELFVCWVVGDIAKLIQMKLWTNLSIEYYIAVILQIVMNFVVLIK